MRKAEIRTEQLWKPGDMAIYKSYAKLLPTVVLARYKDVLRTEEPRYVIGLIGGRRKMRAPISNQNYSAALNIISHVVSDDLPPSMDIPALRIIEDVISDYERIYTQEDDDEPFRLLHHYRGFPAWLMKQGCRLQEMELSPTYSQHTIENINIVMQHSLMHPLERTKEYKTANNHVANHRN